jgi:hypothetical protein
MLTRVTFQWFNLNQSIEDRSLNDGHSALSTGKDGDKQPRGVGTGRAGFDGNDEIPYWAIYESIKSVCRVFQ